MKKMFLPILLCVFTGSFDEIDAAVNGAVPGGGASLTETETEGAKTLAFTDSKGNSQTAKVGDALVVKNGADGNPIGVDLMPAHEVATLVDPSTVGGASTEGGDTASADTNASGS